MVRVHPPGPAGGHDIAVSSQGTDSLNDCHDLFSPFEFPKNCRRPGAV